MGHRLMIGLEIPTENLCLLMSGDKGWKDFLDGDQRARSYYDTDIVNVGPYFCPTYQHNQDNSDNSILVCVCVDN